MNIRMFGHRCLVEHYRPKTSKSAIIIPDATEQKSTHRFGKVVAVGDGIFRDKPLQKPVVKMDDIVMFQINQVMENTQKYVLDDRHFMNLNQGEVIGRLTGGDITIENFEMVGEFVLLKHFFRQPKGTKIILPEDAMRQSASDFIYFKVMLKGGSVDKPFEIGDEVVANYGRLTPIFFVKRDLDGTSENVEYCYTHQDWIDGVISEEEAA
jgi:co-chaperonin GroES (HSP10)